MGTLRLVSILMIIESSLVLSMKLLQDSSDKHVKEKLDVSHRLFKRQMQCKEGEYPAGEICCKSCHKGTFAASDCTEAQGQPVCKECIDGVDFMDKENGYKSCQRCRSCESGSGHEELQRCTKTQNTLCKCKKEYFCSDETCSRCQRCTICDNGIDEECTSTKDTVCKNPSVRTHLILWPILVGIVIITIIVFVLRKRCKKTQENTEEPDSIPFIPPNPTCPHTLENIKLENHLYEITSLMGQESVQKLVTKQLSPVVQEEIRKDNQCNAREEKFELLKKWYNAHGRQGAFKMLIENCTNREAEKIIDFVQKENEET